MAWPPTPLAERLSRGTRVTWHSVAVPAKSVTHPLNHG